MRIAQCSGPASRVDTPLVRYRLEKLNPKDVTEFLAIHDLHYTIVSAMAKVLSLRAV